MNYLGLAMAGVDDFQMFGEDFLPPEAPEVQEVQPAQQGNSATTRLNWTPLMSAHMLQKFTNLVAEGVRTDKGFKDFHVNVVTKDLQAFCGQPVVTSQVSNHLRKWRTKWQKVERNQWR